MAQNLNINGAIFPFPEDGDDNWGPVVTAWANAVSTGLLQKAGGSFTLTAEVVFGDNFSLKGKYFKFISGVLSDNKIVNLKAPATPIASSYDLILPTSQGSQHSVLKYGLLGQLEHGKITDANIEAGTIDVNKLAALTPDKAIITDSNGFLTESSITNIELGYLSGLTSSVQSQIDSNQDEIDDAELRIDAIETNIPILDAENVKITGNQSIAGIKTFTDKMQVEKAVGTPIIDLSAGTNIDMSLGNMFKKTISSNTTFTFTNYTVGQVVYVLVKNSGSHSVTWPSTVKWPSQVNPIQTPLKTDLYCFTVINATTSAEVVVGTQIQDLDGVI